MDHRASVLGRGHRDDHLDSPRILFRRALVLCGLTVVAPGSAQYVAGRWRLGIAAFSVWVGLLLLGAVLLRRFRSDRVAVLDQLLDPQILLAARFGVALVAIGWIALLIDAWRLAQPFTLSFPRAAVVTAVNTTLVLAMGSSAVVASQAIEAPRRVIQEVFTATETSAPLEGRYNILLIGSDSGKDRAGIRPDSMTVASIDAETGGIVLVSLPRNLQNVPFPEDSPMRQLYPNGYNCGTECLLNAVHTAVETRQDLYPNSDDPGLDATIDAVEGATDLPINYFVMANMKGFSSLVDAVGGVEVDVKSRIAKFGTTTVYKQEYIEPGTQVLTGDDALWYARSRYQSDDYARMGRQKCLMSYMLEQLSPQKVVLNAQDIATSSTRLLETNMPAKELGQFADLALKARGAKIRTVSLVPPEVSVQAPDFDAIHQKIADMIDKSERGPAAPSPSTDDSPDPGDPTETSPDPTTTDGTGTVDDPSEANSTEDLAETC